MVDNRLTEAAAAAVEIGRHQPRADARTAVDDEHLARQPRRRVREQEERTGAMSSGTPMRRSGCAFAMPSSFGSQSARAMSVLTRPGATALARAGGELLRELPRQVDEGGLRRYAPMNGPGRIPPTETTLRMTPPCSRIHACRSVRSAAGR
jgi:hypothetical protein